MMTRIVASVVFAALVGTTFVTTAEAGLFGRRAYGPFHHHAPRVEYRTYESSPTYYPPSTQVIRHVNDPSLYRDQSGYGES
ncbi:hypothetical protein C5Y96_02375 [Blastopirellula marina]|uniref:Uncharacterized protein n=1 Tax=Blastopirellula marina TaxID=124 RepID=A0A2S8G2S6_9BACT|nr:MULTISPECIES: hypothetical protein [Pirellulaceae]PQO38746.1 hypothetical protein C5Y96_02375 [Blastopirellula marina]RCS55054.1 hypothetical protein DTL36_02380 [Bremerella cremea]